MEKLSVRLKASAPDIETVTGLETLVTATEQVLEFIVEKRDLFFPQSLQQSVQDAFGELQEKRKTFDKVRAEIGSATGSSLKEVALDDGGKQCAFKLAVVDFHYQRFQSVVVEWLKEGGTRILKIWDKLNEYLDQLLKAINALFQSLVRAIGIASPIKEFKDTIETIKEMKDADEGED